MYARFPQSHPPAAIHIGGRPAYHRETGHKIDLMKAPLGSAEFLAECEKIRTIVEANRARAPKVGTLGGLLLSYFETEHFANLAPATRRDYRQCADFLEPIRDTPIHVIDTPLVAGTIIEQRLPSSHRNRQADQCRHIPKVDRNG